MEERFAIALGKAVIGAWSGIPRDVQESLFEKAVIAGHQSERDESFREELAAYLHELNSRTKT